MKNKKSTLVLVAVFILGISLLLYPTFSDWWNSFHQTRAIASYAENVAVMDDESYEEMWERARAYNEALAETGIRWSMTEEELEDYESQLNVSGTGIMGYVEIPSINCTLPVYHGTDDAVLQIAVGHIEGSSLPVGGPGTHCILSGHRGLPSARLFTDIDRLEEGDTFYLHTLDETLAYEVDQIRIVLPYELEELEIVEGEDLCTLVTCTPYGINSHRLLVRGHRVDMQEQSAVRVTADAVQIEPLQIAPFVAAPLLLALFIWVMAATRKRKR